MAEDGELAMLGLDYRTAPLGVRERLRLEREEQVRELLSAIPHPAVVVSTCHRVEVYVRAQEPGRALDGVEVALAERSGLSQAAVAAHSRRRFGEDAARHAIEVACGLQSVVVGEPQVLGQVRAALQIARQAGRADGVLTRLFEQAVHAGKRVRTETRTGRSGPSLARAAVRRLAQSGLALRGAHLLVVGAGEMAMLAVREGAAAGVGRVTICARRPAEALAAAQAAVSGPAPRLEVHGFDALGDDLAVCDAVISATSAPGPVIRAEMLARALGRREPGRLLRIIDLAVPRDVEPPDPLPPQLWLFTVDELGDQAAPDPPDPEELHRAHAIVGQETAAFMEWARQRASVPALVSMRRHAEEICQQELQWAWRRLGPRLDEDARRVVGRMAERLTQKLLHLPTLYLKSVGPAPGEDGREGAPWEEEPGRVTQQAARPEQGSEGVR